MASKKAHLHQAGINHEVFQALGGIKPKYRDWAITFLFYIGVHQVEAAFACISGVGHSETCRERGNDMSITRYKLVKNHLGKDAAYHFNILEQASKSVRYLINNYQQYYSESTVSDFYKTDLGNVRKAAEAKYKGK